MSTSQYFREISQREDGQYGATVRADRARLIFAFRIHSEEGVRAWLPKKNRF